MPRRKKGYQGNPLFHHLRIDEEAARVDAEEAGRQHKTATSDGLFYQVEGEVPNLRPEHGGDIGSDEDENSQAGPSGLPGRARGAGGKAPEQSEPYQGLGRRQRGGGGGSPSSSRRSMTAIASPLRELKIRLTKTLSSRENCIRRFVDFTLCNSDSSPKMFGIVKDEQDVCRLKNGDYLLRVRLTFNTKHHHDDPYVKDYVAEIKFRGRLFKYNEERDSFLEVAVVSQCMAICTVPECRRVPALAISPH